MIGEFRDGAASSTARRRLHGRTVLVRGVWSDIKPNSHHFEIAYSQDGGRNWEPPSSPTSRGCSREARAPRRRAVLPASLCLAAAAPVAEPRRQP